MSPELQKELAAWLTQMRDALQKGGDFVLAQAPLVVREKVAAGRVYSTLCVGACCAVLVGIVGVTAVGLAHAATGDDRAAWGLVGGIAATIALGVTVGNAETCVKAWVAPRLYVLEWLKGFIA